MNKKTVEKYFNNQATPEQTVKVLEWFETFEGQQYLQERLDDDIALMGRSELAKLVPELDSKKLYGSIQKKIKQKKSFNLNHIDWVGYTIKVAAVILVIIIVSLFHITHKQYKSEQITKLEHEPVIFTTKDDQHRDIRLGDGSIVWMNSNSEIVISKDYMSGAREIILSGEAFFDVAHNTDRPFIIHANRSTIEVLGTAFNVRIDEDNNALQVAVTDGKVHLKSKEKEYDQYSQQLSVILSKNQYGYMDLENRSIVVDDLGIENYLAWKSGRLSFEDLSLKQVCTQLTRLYSLECHFKQEEVSELTLTASFSNESLEKSLSVIALTLEIDFRLHENRVSWFNDGRKINQEIGKSP